MRVNCGDQYPVILATAARGERWSLAAMDRTLVAYYSLSGHTRTVATAIAERCGADLEAVRERHPPTGFHGLLRIGWQALTGRRAQLCPAEHDPADYDLVIIGTPVWAASVPPAMRTWLREHGTGLRRVAFFCTGSGSGDEHMLARMREISGREPAATLIVPESELREQRYTGRVAAFAEALGLGKV
jgi:flavodoxin